MTRAKNKETILRKTIRIAKQSQQRKENTWAWGAHHIVSFFRSTSMDVRGSRFTVLPWSLVEASMEIHGSFYCRWRWKLALLPSTAVSTVIFRGGFHELPYTPPTSTSITNFQLHLHDFRWGPTTCVRCVSLDVATNVRGSFYESQFTSMETSI